MTEEIWLKCIVKQSHLHTHSSNMFNRKQRKLKKGIFYKSFSMTFVFFHSVMSTNYGLKHVKQCQFEQTEVHLAVAVLLDYKTNPWYEWIVNYLIQFSNIDCHFDIHYTVLRHLNLTDHLILINSSVRALHFHCVIMRLAIFWRLISLLSLKPRASFIYWKWGVR